MKHKYTQYPVFTECGNEEGTEYFCGCGYICESFGEIQEHIKNSK